MANIKESKKNNLNSKNNNNRFNSNDNFSDDNICEIIQMAVNDIEELYSHFDKLTLFEDFNDKETSESLENLNRLEDFENCFENYSDILTDTELYSSYDPLEAEFDKYFVNLSDNYNRRAFLIH
ncbi:MAG: hypothetical protein ACOX3T_02280 [Bdellovibrionota bacterium]